MTRDELLRLDQADPLRAHRHRFALPDGLLYFDGNSLGPPPRATAAQLARVVEAEWGERLIEGWSTAGWFAAPRRVGAMIADLVGAAPDEVVCADSTSVNLFKVLATALRLQAARPQVSMRARRVIVIEAGGFPTDAYVVEGLVDLLGGRHEIRRVRAGELAGAIDDGVAVVLLAHVNYRSGALHDMATLTRLAHAVGALTVWDLAHSAGAVPVHLNGCAADFAVGCGYKFLNGGPGAPAFAFAAARHLAALDEQAEAAGPAPLRLAQPICGWIGHRAPFAFEPQHVPARGIDRFMVGTPPVIGLAALEAGVEAVREAGVAALYAKAGQLGDRLIELVLERCAGHGLQLASPQPAARRGSQVSFTHPHAESVCRALAARRVVCDFRPPDVLRFGLAPLVQRYVELWDAVEVLREVLASRDGTALAPARPPQRPHAA